MSAEQMADEASDLADKLFQAFKQQWPEAGDGTRVCDGPLALNAVAALTATLMNSLPETHKKTIFARYSQSVWQMMKRGDRPKLLEGVAFRWSQN